jgi:hypothetical protein
MSLTSRSAGLFALECFGFIVVPKERSMKPKYSLIL